MVETISHRFFGDKERGRALIGFSNQCVEVLKNLVELSGLNTFKMVKNFDTGEMLEFNFNYGIITVNVICPPRTASEEQLAELRKQFGAMAAEGKTWSPLYVFFTTGGVLKVASCTYAGNTFTLKDIVNVTDYNVSTTANADNFIWQTKRFSHNVNGTVRDLYFIVTSFYISNIPSVGWDAFKTANPTFALVTNNDSKRLACSTTDIDNFNAVNKYVNGAFTYVAEVGGSENWKLLTPGGSGDCEDFALTKAKMLLDMGYPASVLHIETGLYKDGSTVKGHAWLVVQTIDGDIALDLNSSELIANSVLKFGDEELYCRRRQIGSNWACISDFSWLLSATAQPYPYTCWYVFDPLLNIFYILDNTTTYRTPFLVANYINDPFDYSYPSINFSAGNDAIYFASNETIRTYELRLNELKLVSTSAYSGLGYVGRNGTIESPDTYGVQDPWADVTSMIEVTQFGTPPLWHLSAIDESIRGPYKILQLVTVLSKDGYYEYLYKYLIGENTVSGSVEDTPYEYEYTDGGVVKQATGYYETLEVKADMESGSDYFHYFEKTVRTHKDPTDTLHEEIMDCTSEPKVASYRGEVESLISKTRSYYLVEDQEILDDLLWDYTHHYEKADEEHSYTLFGETIPYYTVVGSYPTEMVSDADIYNYNRFYPYSWLHIEMGDYLIHGIHFMRATDAGDNFKKLFIDGSALSVSTVALPALNGIAYVPGANRLTGLNIVY